MKEYAWVVFGFTADGRDDVEWPVAVYADEEAANLHLECLQIVLASNQLAGSLDPVENLIDALRKSLAAWDANIQENFPQMGVNIPAGYRVVKVPMPRHPDEYQEEFGR